MNNPNIMFIIELMDTLTQLNLILITKGIKHCSSTKAFQFHAEKFFFQTLHKRPVVRHKDPDSEIVERRSLVKRENTEHEADIRNIISKRLMVTISS